MAPRYGASHFLDADEHENDSTLIQQSASLVRPWEAWWPPQKNRELYRWLSAEFPEALTWQFDPEKPFDRPWQKWNKIVHPDNRTCRSTSLPAKEHDYPVNEQLLHPHSLPVDETNPVESLIQALSLPYLTPERFTYLAPLQKYSSEKPYHSRLPFLNGLRRTNIVGQTYNDVKVYDFTGAESSFRLHETGFEFVKIPVTAENWTDTFVGEHYLADMASWLERRFKCQKAHTYAYNFRSSGEAPTSTAPWIGPFLRAHADVTAKSSTSRLKLHLSLEDESIQKKKFCYVALWRPLSGPTVDCPLAVCDFRTVRSSDVVEADVVFPHYCDESYEVLCNPSHRWFFKPGMTKDEAILFNLWDSSPGNATFCVHSAFEYPFKNETTSPRRSVELRAILEW